MTNNDRYVRDMINLVRERLKTQDLDCQDKYIKQAIRDSVYLDSARILNYLDPHTIKIKDTRWKIYERKSRYANNEVIYYLIHIGCKGPKSKCHSQRKTYGYIYGYGNCSHEIPEHIQTQFKLI